MWRLLPVIGLMLAMTAPRQQPTVVVPPEPLTWSVDSPLETIRPNPESDSPEQSEELRQRLLQRLVRQPVSDQLRMVHIFRDTINDGVDNDVFVGSGVYLTIGGHPVVLSTRDVFVGLDQYLFSFRRLPEDDGLYGIRELRLTNLVDVVPTYDLVLCLPGPCEPITGFGLDQARHGLPYRMVPVAPEEDRWVRSLTTGQRHRILAIDNQRQELIIDYRPLYGESGTGFIDPVNNVLILGGTLTISDEMRQDENFPDDIYRAAYTFFVPASELFPAEPRRTNYSSRP
jgi:hypothetical protein